MEKINLIGKKFGKLTVIAEAPSRRRNNGGLRTTWMCKCECGNTVIVDKDNLGRSTLSCGCFKNELLKTKQETLRLSKTRIYRIYCGMKSRCYNKNNKKAYKYYGARDIKICSEWLKNFKSFYNWSISNGYKDDLTIDRIDVNGDYEPSNCRWVTILKQSNNKRNNNYLIFNGERHTVKEWSIILNIPYGTIQNRLHKLNWSVERTLATPNNYMKMKKEMIK